MLLALRDFFSPSEFKDDEKSTVCTQILTVTSLDFAAELFFVGGVGVVFILVEKVISGLILLTLLLFSLVAWILIKLRKLTAASLIMLALVKRIVGVHGGKMWIGSQGCNYGSTFLHYPPLR